MGDHFLEEYFAKAKEKQREHKKFLEKLKKKPPKNLDQKMEEIHEDVFNRIDCLSYKLLILFHFPFLHPKISEFRKAN